MSIASYRAVQEKRRATHGHVPFSRVARDRKGNLPAFAITRKFEGKTIKV